MFKRQTALVGAILLLCLSARISECAEPAMSSEFIFPGQSLHCHGSSVVECPNGDLLACWFYGSGERSSDDVAIQGARLKKGEQAWSPVFPMADTPNFPDCNPVLFLDPKGRLRLVWITVLGHGWQHSILKIKTSENFEQEGAPVWNWQDVILLNPGDKFAEKVEAGFRAIGADDELWSEYSRPYPELILEAARDLIKTQTGWMTRIHPAILPSGRILLPLYSDGFNLCLMAISDDQGDTWRTSDPIVGLGPIQPTVARRKDGALAAYMRDSGGKPARALYSESKDDGQTWSPAVDSEIFNPGSSLEVIVLSDGDWVLVYNDTENGRHQLAIALSADEGRTWGWKRYLEKADFNKGSYAYPSVMQSRDGRIHVTYTHNENEIKTIKHVSLDKGWIKDSSAEAGH